MIFKESVYVVDTCAFIGGLTQLIGEVKLYTVPEVIKELENNDGACIEGLTGEQNTC
ncbi:MAG: hypothetical protein QW739_05415 [Candidatus Odinarchaeota archaeon]